jgi:hypothetical protein
MHDCRTTTPRRDAIAYIRIAAAPARCIAVFDAFLSVRLRRKRVQGRDERLVGWDSSVFHPTGSPASTCSGGIGYIMIELGSHAVHCVTLAS